jgi:hypothetical protein
MLLWIYKKLASASADLQLAFFCLSFAVLMTDELSRTSE